MELGASLVGARFIDSDSLSGENNSSLDGEWISARDIRATLGSENGAFVAER